MRQYKVTWVEPNKEALAFNCENAILRDGWFIFHTDGIALKFIPANAVNLVSSVSLKP